MNRLCKGRKQNEKTTSQRQTVWHLLVVILLIKEDHCIFVKDSTPCKFVRNKWRT